MRRSDEEEGWSCCSCIHMALCSWDLFLALSNLCPRPSHVSGTWGFHICKMRVKGPPVSAWMLECFASQQEELEKINSQQEEIEKIKLQSVSKRIVKAKSRMFFCQCPSSALPEQFWLLAGSGIRRRMPCTAEHKVPTPTILWFCSAARWSGQTLSDVLVGWEMENNTHRGLVWIPREKTNM